MAARIQASLITILFLAGTAFTLSAQRSESDSLLNVYHTSKRDTSLVKTMNELAWAYLEDEPDTAMMWCDSTIDLATKLNWKPGVAIAENTYGNLFYDRSDFPRSVKHYLAAIAVWESLDIGADKAQKEKNSYHRMVLYGNLGNVYKEENDPEKALTYYNKSLAIAQHFSAQLTIARQLNNIGIVYKRRKDYESALFYYEKAVKIFESIPNKAGEAIALGNIGNVYVSQGKPKLGFDYLQRSLLIKQEMGSRSGVAIGLCNLGNVCIDMKEYGKAKDYLSRAIALADSVHSTVVLRDANKFYAEMDSILGDYRDQLIRLKAYVAARDSIANEDDVAEQTRTEMLYEFDKKQAGDSIRNAEKVNHDNLLHEQEIHQQRIYTSGGAAGFLLMLIVAFVSFRAFRNKKKANEIIEHQKLLVEIKQKEIIDSINYAKRIQNSLLPGENRIHINIKRLNGS